MDFAEARRRMVDGQVKPNRVTDPRILLAMQEVPRELFVPPALRTRALADEDLALGRGRVLLQPMTIARLIQLAMPRGGRAGARRLGAAPATARRCSRIMGVPVIALEDDAVLADMGGAGIAAAGLPPGALRREAGLARPPASRPAPPTTSSWSRARCPPCRRPWWSSSPRAGGSSPSGSRRAGRRRHHRPPRRGQSFSAAEAFDVQGTPLPAFAPRAGLQSSPERGAPRRQPSGSAGTSILAARRGRAG